MKQESQLMTYAAGPVKSMVDYIIVRQDDKAKGLPLWPSGLNHWPRCTLARVRFPARVEACSLPLRAISLSAGVHAIGLNSWTDIPGVHLCPL